MAVSPVTHALIALTLVFGLIGSALLWAAFDTTHAFDSAHRYERVAQFEASGFLVFAVVCAVVVWNLQRETSYAAARTLAVGIALYLLVLSNFTSFNVLNNVRIVGQADSTVHYQVPLVGSTAEPDVRQKWLAGLIIGYLAIFFGLLGVSWSQIEGAAALTKNKLVAALWIFALVLLIIGNIVAWTSASASTYAGSTGTDYVEENALFGVTTVIMLQWFVLTLGLASTQSDLLAASGFIFGVLTLYIPTRFFLIESYYPSNSEYIWAGLILDWFAAFLMAIAAVWADNESTSQASKND